MKRLLVVVLVLGVALGALGYWRGWFSLTTAGKVDVQVNSAKFKQDKDEFSKTVGVKAQAMKGQITNLWKNVEGLTGDEKDQAQKELGDLEKKHDRLEQQIKEVDDAGPGRFESIRQDLSNTLAEVEKHIEELTTKLEKRKEK